MNADVKTKRKRDHNNFIEVILSKISLAQNFHQRIALSITSKQVLNHVNLKFYLRRRHDKLFLYIRPKDKFGNIAERHKFYQDILLLFPQIELTSTQGHYTGFLLELNPETHNTLIKLLKFISLLAYPKDFYCEKRKTSLVYINSTESSKTPIHLNFSNKVLTSLSNYDLTYYLLQYIVSKDVFYANTN